MINTNAANNNINNTEDNKELNQNESHDETLFNNDIESNYTDKESTNSTLPLHVMNNLKTQGGGHIGILQGRKGKHATIAKPLSTEREGLFYKKIKNTPLYENVPKFYGMKKEVNFHNNNNDIKQNSNDIKQNNKVKYWLFLQDMTANMSSPCIADLKIGTRTYEINVPQFKQERQKSLLKGTTTLSHAVRCIDICIRQNNNIIQRWNRKTGRKMSWSDLHNAIEYFLSSKQKVEQFKDQLKNLRSNLVETYKILPNMRLYSASILIVYDGDKENGPLTLKLIDFGHGYTDLAEEGGNVHDHTCDDNALLGIDSLLSVTDSILHNMQ